MDVVGKVSQIDPDMLYIMIGIKHAVSVANLRFHGPAHDITRSKLLHLGRIFLHEGH